VFAGTLAQGLRLKPDCYRANEPGGALPSRVTDECLNVALALA
jgi:hypothetical protein